MERVLERKGEREGEAERVGNQRAYSIVGIKLFNTISSNSALRVMFIFIYTLCVAVGLKPCIPMFQKCMIYFLCK